MVQAAAAIPLEIHPSTAEACRHVPRAEPPSRTHAPRHPTVLLIDDCHHHRIPLLRALRAEGYDVLYAADGVRGEELSRTSLREIEALIACAEMKRMSGSELARRVRMARPNIAVLLMRGSQARRERAGRASQSVFPAIEEPFTPDELMRRLAEVLSVRRRGAPGSR